MRAPDSVINESPRVFEGVRRIVGIGHLDLDGVASVAVVARWARRAGVEFGYEFAGVKGVYRVVLRALRLLSGYPGRSVVLVADFGLERSYVYVFKPLLGRVSLVWVDHHVWGESVREEAERAGIVVVHDRSDVSAGLVCGFLGLCGDSVSARLVELARYDDSCREDPGGLVSKWRVVLRALQPRDYGRVVEAFAEGVFWPAWAEELYRRVYPSYYDEARRETRVHRHVFDGVRVAVVVPPPRISGCDLELMGLVPGPGEVDVVVYLYPRSISIRTWGGLRADCIARGFGGGGHANAAGAPRGSQSLGPASIARLVAKHAAKCGRGR